MDIILSRKSRTSHIGEETSSIGVSGAHRTTSTNITTISTTKDSTTGTTMGITTQDTIDPGRSVSS